jgi:hypothetical protein
LVIENLSSAIESRFSICPIANYKFSMTNILRGRSGGLAPPIGRAGQGTNSLKTAGGPPLNPETGGKPGEGRGGPPAATALPAVASLMRQWSAKTLPDVLEE